MNARAGPNLTPPSNGKAWARHLHLAQREHVGQAVTDLNDRLTRPPGRWSGTRDQPLGENHGFIRSVLEHVLCGGYCPVAKHVVERNRIVVG